jgi:membrane-bound serine protease (ClpP class)
MIRVHGELWKAESPKPVQEGETVRILRVEGLKLYVEPAEVPVSAAK